ncbi:MAG: hypothetical protein R3C15_15610 [Thermoleophilia bacterium]
MNTALLHPRGLGLSVHLDDGDPDAPPIGLSVVARDEPWIFEPGQQHDVLDRYESAEARRELRWAAALRSPGARVVEPAEPDGEGWDDGGEEQQF